MSFEFKQDKDQLRQRLLELHYDLLTDEEAAEVRNAIEKDPEVASEWAQTLRLAGKMADAAKFEGTPLPRLNLSQLMAPPSGNGSVPAQQDPLLAATASQPSSAPQPASQPAATVTPTKRSDGWFALSTAFAATAAMFGLIVIGGWYFERVPSRPAAVVQLEAEAVTADDATATNEFRLLTKRTDASVSAGRFPVTPATLSFTVLSKNIVLFSGKTQTDDSGRGRIQLPDDLIIPKESKLHVTAMSADAKLSATSIELPLQPTRCLTYLTVDRPVYRPGEMVFFRSLTLQRRTLRASAEVPIRFELLDPSGAAVAGAFLEGVTQRGVGNGSFAIPSTAPGGPYTLVAKSLDDFFPEESVEFQVRAYRVPRIKKELEFRQRSYGPGEVVQADFSAEHAEGGPVAGAAVQVTATVDNQVVYQQQLTTSEDGTLAVSFPLPSIIREGSGQLSLFIDDGGTKETKSKTIPIQLGRVAVDFYPEGGYLVADLKNRVYFAARDTLGNPIEVAGEIQDRSGRSVATVKTTRDGMGKFELTPVLGETYTLRVTQPVDVEDFPTLPSVVKNLPVIDTGLGVFDPNLPLSMIVRTRKPMTALVQAACRGEVVGEKAFDLSSGENSLSLPIRRVAGGVIRVTVLDTSTQPAMPLVERLVYRRTDRQLSVEIVNDESDLARSPGDGMRLSLQVRDESGNGVPAVLGVSVVDDASLSLLDKERPSLKTHFLLTSEIQKPEDLEHADLYLSDGQEAATSLDLLLGTQGWRRFVRDTDSNAQLDFRQQLIRLIELDGDPNLAESQQAKSGAEYRRQLEQYRAGVQVAWARLVEETRILLLVALFVWLASVMLHLLRNRRTAMAGMWLLAAVSLAVVGCGASMETSVVAPAQDQASRNADAMMDVESDGYFESEEAGSEETPAADESSATEPTPPTVEPSASQVRDDTEPLGPGEGSTVHWPNEETSSTIERRSIQELIATGPRSIAPEDLQRLLEARGLDAETLADELLRELRFPVRQYAHRYQPNTTDERSDFTETLYWQPMLITDSEGRANIRFDLSDSVSSFRVRVDGHTADGRLGSGGGEVISRLPFQLEPKLPLEVTAGDVIDLPIAIVNATEQPTSVQLSVATDPALQVVDSDVSSRMITIPADSRGRQYVRMNVLSGAGERDAAIRLRGTSSSQHSDNVLRMLRIAPAGYPMQRSVAGRLNGRTTIELPIPDEIVPDSLAVTVRAYPSPLADVMSGVESILREPHGCFEQTSATNYPNAMALQYLRESETANPDVSRKALGMLDRGYGKLVSFECEQLGYEWFGDDPGHEALSAFGLMQFTDMAKVMNVNAEMMQRTRAWLLGRRDGIGGFHRNPRHLHVWSVKQPIVNAYVLWAISEADVAAGHPHRAANELSAEIEQMLRVADQSDDPYLIALSAATLMNVRRVQDGETLLQRLTDLQQEDGSLQGVTTVTSSGGISRTMETTALAALAWVKSPQYIGPARAATTWIQSNRVSGGGFGSTQATVLALKALVAISKHSQSSAGSVLEARLNGKIIGQVRLPKQPQNGSTVEIKGLGQAIEAARGNDPNITFELVSQGSQNLSFSVDVSTHVRTPDSHRDCPVAIQTRWVGQSGEAPTVADGSLLKVAATLTNQTQEGQPMTVAVVGLPGGVEPRTEELDELKASGKFDYYEIRGRDVVLYWRTVEPRDLKEVEFHVTATVPGTYTGPASRAYLYYTAEQKQWSKPIKLTIE